MAPLSIEWLNIMGNGPDVDGLSRFMGLKCFEAPCSPGRCGDVVGIYHTALAVI